MPRYVILEHDHPFLHWDFMLEAGAVLRTWRLEAPPEPGRVIRAEALADHRLHYLDYEGPVSGDRGTVKRWDAGNYSVEMSAGCVIVQLEGKRCQGTAVLQGDADKWSFVFHGNVSTRDPV